MSKRVHCTPSFLLPACTMGSWNDTKTIWAIQPATQTPKNIHYALGRAKHPEHTNITTTTAERHDYNTITMNVNFPMRPAKASCGSQYMSFAFMMHHTSGFGFYSFCAYWWQVFSHTLRCFSYKLSRITYTHIPCLYTHIISRRRDATIMVADVVVDVVHVGW